MGKTGNKKRQETKKQQLLMSQALEDAMKEDEKILGARGVPDEENVIRHVDFLGKKIDSPRPTLRMLTPEEAKGALGSGAGTSIITVPAKANDDTNLLPKRRVTLIRDHPYDFPPLCWNIYVMGDWDVANDEARFASIFARALCRKAKSIEDADLVVFGGGSDVDPSLYGAEQHKKTFFNRDRDDSDIAVYMECFEKGIPMFGVCRGAQFLHVMNGGKLYQHVDNHVGDHTMWDIKNKVRIDKISSVHHQACMRNDEGGMEIIASSSESTQRDIDNKTGKAGKGMDVEAFWYPDTACFGVQGHPEYSGYGRYTKWCLEMLDDLINNNPDIDYFKNADGENRKRILPVLVNNRLMPDQKKGKK